MAVHILNNIAPITKFAPNLQIPFYKSSDGSDKLIDVLNLQILDLEKIIEAEELVSEVPKNKDDPYPLTQQWKQHNLFWDRSALDGEHLRRFEMTPEIEKLFHIIRKQYLLFLKESNSPRIKVYIHGWANVLRSGQWISHHFHQNDEHSYLSGTYYLTTSDTYLDLINPVRQDLIDRIATTKKSIVMFPSYVPHASSVYTGNDVRISVAFDLAVEHHIKTNPWRPTVLFDDPDTMEGIEMYLKDRSLTSY